jgi:hypothetical protein
MLPSAEHAYALDLNAPVGKSPSPTMPVEAFQRNASASGSLRAETLWPTMTSPEAEEALAIEKKPPPARSPRPTRPEACVQRNASTPPAERPKPTINRAVGRDVLRAAE